MVRIRKIHHRLLPETISIFHFDLIKEVMVLRKSSVQLALHYEDLLLKLVDSSHKFTLGSQILLYDFASLYPLSL